MGALNLRETLEPVVWHRTNLTLPQVDEQNQELGCGSKRVIRLLHLHEPMHPLSVVIDQLNFNRKRFPDQHFLDVKNISLGYELRIALLNSVRVLDSPRSVNVVESVV